MKQATTPKTPCRKVRSAAARKESATAASVKVPPPSPNLQLACKAMLGRRIHPWRGTVAATQTGAGLHWLSSINPNEQSKASGPFNASAGRVRANNARSRSSAHAIPLRLSTKSALLLNQLRRPFFDKRQADSFRQGLRDVASIFGSVFDRLAFIQSSRPIVG